MTLKCLVNIDGDGADMPNTRRLIAELRDRAAQFEAAESEPNLPVSHEDLAAHITTSRRASEADGWGGTAVDDHIAGDLLSDYSITKK